MESQGIDNTSNILTKYFERHPASAPKMPMRYNYYLIIDVKEKKIMNITYYNNILCFIQRHRSEAVFKKKETKFVYNGQNLSVNDAFDDKSDIPVTLRQRLMIQCKEDALHALKSMMENRCKHGITQAAFFVLVDDLDNYELDFIQEIFGYEWQCSGEFICNMPQMENALAVELMRNAAQKSGPKKAIFAKDQANEPLVITRVMDVSIKPRIVYRRRTIMNFLVAENCDFTIGTRLTIVYADCIRIVELTMYPQSYDEIEDTFVTIYELPIVANTYHQQLRALKRLECVEVHKLLDSQAETLVFIVTEEEQTSEPTNEDKKPLTVFKNVVVKQIYRTLGENKGLSLINNVVGAAIIMKHLVGNSSTIVRQKTFRLGFRMFEEQIDDARSQITDTVREVLQLQAQAAQQIM